MSENQRESKTLKEILEHKIMTIKKIVDELNEDDLIEVTAQVNLLDSRTEKRFDISIIKDGKLYDDDEDDEVE